MMELRPDAAMFILSRGSAWHSVAEGRTENVVYSQARARHDVTHDMT